MVDGLWHHSTTNGLCVRCVVRRNFFPTGKGFWTPEQVQTAQNGNGLSVSTGGLFLSVGIFVLDYLVCQGWFVPYSLELRPGSDSFDET